MGSVVSIEAVLADPTFGLILTAFVLLLGLIFVLGMLEVFEQQVQRIYERDDDLWHHFKRLKRDELELDRTDAQETRR